MYLLQIEDEETYGCSIPEGFDGERAAEALKRLPSAELYRKVGEWNHDGSQWNHWICSECGYMWLFRKEEAKFCPNCGVDMRGGEHEKA